MDYRLDLYNAVRNYQMNKNDKEAIFIIVYNTEDGDLFTGIDGDAGVLCSILGDTDKDSIMGNMEVFKDTQKMILNIAFNILCGNSSLRESFKQGIIDVESGDDTKYKISSNL